MKNRKLSAFTMALFAVLLTSSIGFSDPASLGRTPPPPPSDVNPPAEAAPEPVSRPLAATCPTASLTAGTNADIKVFVSSIEVIGARCTGELKLDTTGCTTLTNVASLATSSPSIYFKVSSGDSVSDSSLCNILQGSLSHHHPIGVRGFVSDSMPTIAVQSLTQKAAWFNK